MSKHTLEQLLGSRVRVKVLRFLFRNQTLPFDLLNLSKRVQESRAVATEEVNDLRELGLVKIKSSGNPKKYILNPEFEFFQELESLVLKPSPGERSAMTEKITGLGKVRLAVIAGIFLNQPTDDDISDLLIVGDDIDRSKLSKFLKYIEAQLGQEIKFALMDKAEYKYRMGMFDRFVRVLFDGPHEKLIDKITFS